MGYGCPGWLILVNKFDTLVFGFENARSLAMKCQIYTWIEIYWVVCIGSYSGDGSEQGGFAWYGG